jgi:hypothetical protein
MIADLKTALLPNWRRSGGFSIGKAPSFGSLFSRPLPE